jgi:hypothetical protein
MFVSTDGRTFAMPPEDWVPGPSERRGGYFGSGSQSLAADLVRDGITGVSAHVDEPYLDATIRPQILFPAYLAGFTLAEAFYLAMPYLSWQTMVLGDPLAAPFSSRVLTDNEIHRGMDAATSLPALFSTRRLDNLARNGLNRAAVESWLRAGAMADLGRPDDVESALVRAVTIEPRLFTAQFQLAAYYEKAGAHDKARARYEQVLVLEPDQPVALNNLAYSLAVHGGNRARAKELAERAYRLTRSPAVADTLGWIHHLDGNNRAASPLIETAAAAAPTDVDVLVHAAAVRAALGDRVRARAALEAARTLDARLDERPDVKAISETLGQ